MMRRQQGSDAHDQSVRHRNGRHNDLPVKICKYQQRLREEPQLK